MPPGRRHGGDQQQSSPLPPPPPMPPGRRHGGDQQQSSPLPPPTPMPPGRRHGGDQRQSFPGPLPPPMPPGRRYQRQSSPPPPPPMPSSTADLRALEEQRAREEKEQYIHDLLNKAVAQGNRYLAQRRKELLDATKLEEASITNTSPSSLPQPTWRKVMLDATKLEESSITNASSSSLLQSTSRKVLLDATKLEESSITNTSSSSLSQSTSHEGREEPNVLLLNELLHSATLKESSVTNVPSSSMPQSPVCEVSNALELELNTAPSLSSCISSLSPTGLLIKYFVRVDKGGFVHTYPTLGGPFENLEKAQEAIDSYHVVERKNICMDGLSSNERAVRNALYWPHDGTRKNSAEAFAAMATRRPVQEVVKALLDKYNEENVPLGDPSYELKDIVSYEPCFDGRGQPYRSYSHLNMTVKTKRADGSTCDELIFAEVTCTIDEHEQYALTCFCTVEPDDNGPCNLCGDEMKHPVKADYKHGLARSPIRCCSYGDADDLYDKLVTVRDEAWLKAEEARVRHMLKEVDEAIKKDRMKYVVPARRQMLMLLGKLE